MEEMTKLEDWKKNNINGQIAVKLKELWKDKWEKVYMCGYDSNSLKYQGRKMGLGLKVVWSKVGDIPDESDYVYTADLWDLAVCSDFYDAIIDLQKEKRFNLEISDIISFKDCSSILWSEYQSINDLFSIIRESWLKNKDILNGILGGVVGKLNLKLSHYTVAINDNWEFCLRATDLMSKRSIINKDSSFVEDMRKIKEYLDQNIAEIKLKVKNAVDEEKMRDDELKKSQDQKAKDLQKQL